MSVQAMVVLLERDGEDGTVAVSRGWVIPPEAVEGIDAHFRLRYGDPVQEGMRDLISGQDVWKE